MMRIRITRRKKKKTVTEVSVTEEVVVTNMFPEEAVINCANAADRSNV